MELDAYIDSLIEQGLSDNEIAVKIEEFKANQTTDENFQQDGVAGADAPSEIAAPEDTESQPDLGLLDLQDPVQPTPAPFRPEALTEEEKALENQRRQELQPIEPKKRISTRLSATERQQARAKQKDLIDDVEEEFDVEKELRTADDAFTSSLKRVEASILEVPAWLNRKKFLIEKAFMSDEKKEEFDSLSAEEQDAFIQNKYSEDLPISFVPGLGIVPDVGVFSKQGQERAEKVRKEAEEIEKNLIEYDNTITQAFKQGNLKEGATRLLTQVIGTTPSIAQAMIPYAGIPSIFVGQAAEAQREAIYEEGKKIDFKQSVYSDVIGASEALLELTTKKIGKSVFKNLIGKPKELIEKSIRDVGLGIVKAGGAEGLSETSTLAINKFAESKYYNDKGLFEMDEAKWDEFWAEAGDTFLIGMATGKGMAATGAAGGITRNAIGNRSVKKSLDKTSVNEISEAFTNDDINNDVIELSRNDFAERRLDLELKQKVEADELSLEKSEEIKNNFNNARQAVKISDGLNIGNKLVNETVSLIQERSKVSEKIKSAGENKALVSEDIKRLNQIDTRLSNISVENKINIQTEKVTDIVSGLDKINIEIAENQEQADQIAKDKNLSKKASTTDGFILQNPETGEQTIVINKQASVEARAMNVAAHELGHGLLFNTVLKSPETAENLAEALKVELNKIDTGILEDSSFKNRLELYKDDPAAIVAEETLTLFSDALATGQIEYNESVFTKIGDFVRRLLQQAGLSKIEFNTGRDVFNFIKDYNKSIVKGELTKAQQQLATEAATGALVGQTAIDEQAANTFKESKSQEDSKTKQTLDSFTGPAETRKYKTKAEFEASPDYLSAYNYFTEPNPSLDARINSVAAGKGVDFIDVQKVKDNLSLRFVQNFDVSKNSLFGWMLGKTPALNFAVLDVIKEETAKTPTTTTTTAEGATIDIADDVNIEDQIDAAMQQQTEAPRSALKQELQKDGQQFVDQVLEDAIETNTIEIFEGAKPEFTDAALVPFLKQASQQKSFKQIKNKVGDAMTFLKDNDNYKTLFHSKNLPVSVLVAMERNVPVADRIFTGEPTRLTTQDQINKAVNDGDFYVENEKTGPSIYPRKKPTVEQLEKFFNVPAVNPITGKRSGLKGTRKDGLVNAVSFGLFRDITPSVMRKLDKPAADIAKTAEKLVVDPAIKFSLSDPAIKKFDKFDIADTVSRRLFKDSNNQGIDYAKLDEDQKATVRQEMIDKNLGDINNLIIKFSKTKNDKIKTIDNKVFSKNISFEDYSNKLKNEMLKDDEMLSLTRRDFNGKAYELYITNKINSLNIPDLKASSDWVSDVDLVITFKGEKVPTEVKMDYTALLGSANLGYDLQTEKLQNSKKRPVSKTIFKVFENSFIQHEARVKEMIKQAEEISGNKITSMPFRLKKEDASKLDKTGISTQIPISINAVFEHYSRKGINYIIMEGEMFYLKENPLNLNVNQLDFNVVYKARIRPSSSGATRSFNYAVEYFGDRKKSNKPLNGTKLKSIKFSKSTNLNAEFNRIIERSTSIAARKKISEVKATMLGAKKGKFDIFISPSAEDFVGLLYKTLGKGKQGEADLAFYDKHLLKPFAKANNLITSERLALMRDYRLLKKQIGIVPKNLRKEIPGVGFTREQAVRAYIWSKQGMEVPGLNKGDLKELLSEVKKSPELIKFGNQLIQINKGDGYTKPSNNWLVGSITTDLLEGINTTKRAKHLDQWQKNVDIIFSKDNLNKLEASYGTEYRKAMENMLLRMKTGRNRTYGMDSLTGKFTDWVNGSVGAIMFFNTRSAVLQTISAVNFINFKDNNIFAAGKAFANQKQYWKDFVKLFNSDFLLARRDGLRMNVNEADIADMAKKGGVRGVINELLRFGFTPTQLADSFAIASGGSTFYRNRIKTYEKQGLTSEQAEKRAFEDFRENAEESQQSSRPDKISQQQAGSLGRLILAFANTPSQYARIIKKSVLDLKNNRGDAKTNISKIVYYTFAQNLLFNALQQGLFALAFGDDEEDEKKKQKNIDIANGMVSSLLRGMGFFGAAVSAVKDAGLRIYKESEKNQPKYEKAAVDFLKISPPISSKIGKIRSAGKDIQYAKKDQNFKKISIDNPAISAASRVVSATTNVPLDRLLFKSQNVNDALNQDLEDWQRTALLLGWSGWQLGIEEEKDKKEKAKAVGIKRRKVERREVKRR